MRLCSENWVGIDVVGERMEVVSLRTSVRQKDRIQWVGVLDEVRTI